MIPSIVVVGADKGGVGKTMLARALIDYLAGKNLAYRAFDAEYPAGDLKRFVRDAEIVEIGRVEDQMKVFDSVGKERVTVIDLRGGMLSPTINALAEAKLLDDMRNKQLRLILLHVLGPTMSSIAEVGDAAKRLGAGTAFHFVVKNHINNTGYFDWDTEAAQPIWRSMSNVTIDVPQLAEIACETLQKIGGSFVEFHRDRHPAGPQSRSLRGRVETWLEGVWAEFDRVGVGRLLAGDEAAETVPAFRGD